MPTESTLCYDAVPGTRELDEGAYPFTLRLGEERIRGPNDVQRDNAVLVHPGADFSDNRKRNPGWLLPALDDIQHASRTPHGIGPDPILMSNKNVAGKERTESISPAKARKESSEALPPQIDLGPALRTLFRI